MRNLWTARLPQSGKIRVKNQLGRRAEKRLLPKRPQSIGAADKRRESSLTTPVARGDVLRSHEGDHPSGMVVDRLFGDLGHRGGGHAFSSSSPVSACGYMKLVSERTFRETFPVRCANHMVRGRADHPLDVERLSLRVGRGEMRREVRFRHLHTNRLSSERISRETHVSCRRAKGCRSHAARRWRLKMLLLARLAANEGHLLVRLTRKQDRLMAGDLPAAETAEDELLGAHRFRRKGSDRADHR